MKTKHVKKLVISLLLFVVTSTISNAQHLSNIILMADDNEGTFLGTFENEYATNSIFNEYGTYGSKYSSQSIFNQYGNFGSPYSNYSAFNAYATQAPIIVDRNGNSYGRLSINRYAQGVTNDSYKLAMKLKARWNALNK